MTDQMDVDSKIHTSLGLPMSSSSEKLLKELDLNALKDYMELKCKQGLWLPRLDIDDSQNLIDAVVYSLMKELETTKMKNSFISRLEAMIVVDRLDEDELVKWKAMVRDGVEKEDWTALIVHRTYIWIIQRVDDV